LRDPEWSAMLVVLSDLEFNRVELSDTRIDVNVVRSQFRDSEFSQITSRAHFWGAANTWSGCRFKEVRLEDAICPQNRFEHCSFEGFEFIGSNAYETVFSHCTFKNVRFEGFSAKKSTSRKLVRELADTGASVLFVDCSFDDATFYKCRFANVAFVNTAVSRHSVKASDFSGAIGRPQWWKDDETGDPFVAFLDEVLEMIRRRLGAQSVSFGRLQSYRQDYIDGRTTSKDYSKPLYEPGVPNSELDVIEDALEPIERKFGW